jgi:hypothetical protein
MVPLWQQRRDFDFRTLTVGPGQVPDVLPDLPETSLQIQFEEPLAPREHEKLGRLLASRPHAYLRAFCFFGQARVRSLDFLRHYPSLTGFHADLYDTEDFAGLALLPQDIRYVGIGQTKKKVGDLPSLLGRLHALEDLHLEGQSAGLPELLAAHRRLTRLSLRSITLADLAPLEPLAELECLELRLGGSRELSRLPRFERLQYLEIWMVKGLSDLGWLGELRGLQSLFLQSQPQVKALPSLSRLTRLKRVHLETMKGLVDLTPVAQALALEELLLIAMTHLPAEAVRPFIGHPSLKSCRLGFGSKRKNDAAYRLLGLPVPADPQACTISMSPPA